MLQAIARMWRASRGARIESRSTGAYEKNLLLNAFVSAAEGVGDSTMAVALAAVETAAGMWARGFASARISPTNARTAAITTEVRARIGRELARRGECVFAIEVDGAGAVSLGIAGFWNVYSAGSPGARQGFGRWVYRVSEYGPSSTRSRLLPAAGVVHCKYASSPLRPWAGKSPLSFAHLSASFAAKLETALAFESSFVSAQIVPSPENGPTGDALEALKNQIIGLKGSLAMPQGSAGAPGSVGTSTPVTDSWRQRRLGPDFTDGELEARTAVERSIFGAFGIPQSLLDPRAAAASREGFRQFLHLTIKPLAALVIAELADKLEVPDLVFHFDELGAADIAGRARAYGSLIKAGMSDADARRVAGLD